MSVDIIIIDKGNIWMSYDLSLLIKVAVLYYRYDLKQETIARRLKISKYKVNRVLKRTRE